MSLCTTEFSLNLLNQRLSPAVASLCMVVAAHAQQTGVRLYLVGGVNRDLLLMRHTDDLDFAVEGDHLMAAVDFARSLQAIYGGKLTPHSVFGTVKWQFTAESALLTHLGVALDALPDHLDFAVTRAEVYAYPAALPTVSPAPIEQDLKRRDFSINTLALQLSPATHQWRLLDPFNGLDDLQTRTIRVLHDASFLDDPTRILRGVRFAERLNFTLEAHTASLIPQTDDGLGRITGERLRNEFMLILGETKPERSLADLQRRGVLHAIHPTLRYDETWTQHFETARRAILQAMFTGIEFAQLLWHCWFSQLAPDDVSAICDRLLCSGADKISLTTAAKLTRSADLSDSQIKASQIAFQLDGMPEIALLTAWIVRDDPFVRERIERYLRVWRHTRPITTGNTLKALGLPPSPRYKQILERLRAARIDGEIVTDDDEAYLLKTLIATQEGLHNSDDHA